MLVLYIGGALWIVNINTMLIYYRTFGILSSVKTLVFALHLILPHQQYNLPLHKLHFGQSLSDLIPSAQVIRGYQQSFV